MKRNAFFRLILMTIIWFYCIALAQAGQVITQEEKVWARNVFKQEKALGTISTPNSIAVLYFNNRSDRARLTPLQKGMAVMLITDLAKVEQIQVVERTRLQALLDEMELGSSGMMDAETAPEVGLLLRANYVTGGDIFQGTTEELEISSSVFDVPLDKFTPQKAATGAVDEIFKLEKEVLFNIIEHMQVVLSAEKKAELDQPISTSTAALLALFAGVDYSDRGLYLRAANMYKQALIEDPNLAMAQNALLELKGMGLVTPEELTGDNQTSLPAPESDDGLSTGSIVAIGIGMAAVGGGIAYALGQDDDETETPQVDPEDTTPPTVTADPADGGKLNCSSYSGNILFTFSEPMMETGEAVISSGAFAQQGWRGDRVYELRWSGVSICSQFSTVTVTLTGFSDKAGNALADPTSFSYTVSYEETASNTPQ